MEVLIDLNIAKCIHALSHLSLINILMEGVASVALLRAYSDSLRVLNVTFVLHSRIALV